MTKSQTRDVQQTLQHGATLGLDYVARSLSALHRSAMSDKSKREIAEIAIRHRAHLSAEWIV
jgi:hypothetical protein